MAFLREDDIRRRARDRAISSRMDVEEALRAAIAERRDRYDIFLSQTIRDAELVLGVYIVLTDAGYTVFCDWIEAPLEGRHEVSPANAAFVRTVMGVCDSLLFIDSAGAAQSLWMSWELGWFDGARGPVAILPVLFGEERYYRGREFLSLYPYVEPDESGRLRVVRPAVTSPGGITIIEAPNSTAFDDWKSGKSSRMRPRAPGMWRR